MQENNRINPDKTNTLLIKALERLMPEPGTFETGIKGFRMARRNEIYRMSWRFHNPIITLMVQGKNMRLLEQKKSSTARSSVRL
jgi:hypothetical protein